MASATSDGCEFAVAPDGRSLAWLDDGVIVLVDLITGKRRSLSPDSAKIDAFSFSNTGRTLLARQTKVVGSKQVKQVVRTGKIGDRVELVTVHDYAESVNVWNVADGKEL